MRSNRDSAKEVHVEAKPPTRFVISACVSGVLLLSVGAVLIATAIGRPFQGYIPGAAIVLPWVYYVTRPKTKAEMRWNWIYLVLLALATIAAASLINPREIKVLLQYWTMAIVMTMGAPLLLASAVIVVHQRICASAAKDI